MSQNIQYELQLLILSLLTGAGLMMTYDMLRIFRFLIPHHYILIGMEDMLYWIYAGLITFSLLYEQNDGSLRGYAVVSVFAGMLFYDRLISRSFLRFIKGTMKALKKRQKYHRIRSGRKRV